MSILKRESSILGSNNCVHACVGSFYMLHAKDNLQAATTEPKAQAMLRLTRTLARKSTCVAKQLPQIVLGLSAVRCEG